MTDIKARPFNYTDWQFFSGCTYWHSGTCDQKDPVIRELSQDRLIVADPTGVSLIQGVESEDIDDQEWWDLEVKFPTQDAARAFLDGLPVDFNPDDYGFVEDS